MFLYYMHLKNEDEQNEEKDEGYIEDWDLPKPQEQKDEECEACQ